MRSSSAAFAIKNKSNMFQYQFLPAHRDQRHRGSHLHDFSCHICMALPMKKLMRNATKYRMSSALNQQKKAYSFIGDTCCSENSLLPAQQQAMFASRNVANGQPFCTKTLLLTDACGSLAPAYLELRAGACLESRVWKPPGPGYQHGALQVRLARQCKQEAKVFDIETAAAPLIRL